MLTWAAVREKIGKPGAARAVLWSAVMVAGAALLTPCCTGAYVAERHFDPQSPEQELAAYYAAGVFGYTGGLMVGQLIALLLGAWLVTRDSGAPRFGFQVGGAVLAGSLLAAVNGATALLVGSALYTAPPMSAAQIRAAGLPFPPHPLQDPQLWMTFGVGLVAFPLSAAIGAGLGALLGRWRLVLAVVLAWWLLASYLGFVWADLAHPPGPGRLTLFALLPPAASFVSIQWTADAPTAAHFGHETPAIGSARAAVLAGLAVYAIVLCAAGAAAPRRHPSQRS